MNCRTATAYDATRAITAGLEQGNTRDKLQRVLQNENFSTSGSGETVQFLDTRDRRFTAILIQVQSDDKGSYRFVHLH